MHLISASLVLFVSFAISSTNAGTIDKTLLRLLAAGGTKDVILDFPSVLNQVVGNPAVSSLVGNDRRNAIVRLMQQRTADAQLPVLNALNSLGLRDQAKPFWVANRIAVKNVGLGPLQALAALPGRFVIRDAYNATIYPVTDREDLSQEQVRTLRQESGGLQWGVEKIKAKEAWDAGYRGQGVVVGIIDTGVNYQHVALVKTYKNDAYSWHDSFGEYPDAPHDGNQHGTHCAGTIAGTENGIGVAPEAKWIACRGLDDKGSGNETTLLECGEYMSCPSGNSSGACTYFPNIVSNSWGGLVGGMDFYNPVIQLWQAMKIIPVFALGNSGPGCPTAGSPGDQENLISVGSTDKDDGVSRFSSRGPSITTGNIKPEVSAPGGKIVSATHDSNDGYRTLSGTSMACPHAAGTAALILSANPKLEYAEVRKIMESTTYKKPLSFKDAPLVCAVNPFNVGYPNNGYGHGRIDAQAAVAKAKA